MKIFFIMCFILLLPALAMSADYKVLIFVADSSAVIEATILKSFEKIGEHSFKFTEVNIATGGTRPIAGGVKPVDEVKKGKLKFSEYDIIWFAWNGPGHDGDYFMDGVEEDLLKFVENGGIIYMSAFDDNYKDKKGNQIGTWMPIDKYPCLVMNTGDSDAEITPEGEKTSLFTKPNKITNKELNALVLDDNLDPQSNEYITLALRTDNKKPAIVQLNYGKGAYIHCCIDARSTFPAATPLIENMLYYIAGLSKKLAVDSAGKIPSLWGRIKTVF